MSNELNCMQNEENSLYDVKEGSFNPYLAGIYYNGSSFINVTGTSDETAQCTFSRVICSDYPDLCGSTSSFSLDTQTGSCWMRFYENSWYYYKNGQMIRGSSELYVTGKYVMPGLLNKAKITVYNNTYTRE